uniref:Musculoskeletal embryonic nuclear protein 1 n=1 Tax=Amphiprion ocellaris TaxID=80972 RepID=A0AAQ5YGB5_AMPOC
MVHRRTTARLCIYVSVCWAGPAGKRERQLTERGEFLIFSDLTIMSQPAQEDEQIQRPEVREEDVTEARNRLGFSGPAKSKTFEVMEECEKAGKAAPSVFSRARSGAETVLNTRSTPKVVLVPISARCVRASSLMLMPSV